MARIEPVRFVTPVERPTVLDACLESGAKGKVYALERSEGRAVMTEIALKQHHRTSNRSQPALMPVLMQSIGRGRFCTPLRGPDC